MKKVDLLVWTLLVIGGINWGLVGLFNFDLVRMIFRVDTAVRVVYVIVGLAAIYDVVMIKAISTRWDMHFRKPATM